MFDTVLMVDWSGGNDRGLTPKKDAIWLCAGGPEGVEEPLYLRNRQVAEAALRDRLATERAQGRRVLLGFDFPFGYPAGFLAALGLASVFDLWAHYDQALEDSPRGNNRFALADAMNARLPGPGPFWFNALRDELPHLPRKKPPHAFPFAERRLAETRATGAFTCWQMGGAGAVGSQAITGMALLSRLRRDFPVSVWPFEPLAQPIAMVEIWPGLVNSAVRAALHPGAIKDAVQVRVMVETVLAMQHAGRLAPALAAVPDSARAEEGWIFGLGAEESLAAALS